MVKATIYTAPKCPHSENLKKFLQESGVDYEEKCVLANPETIEEVFEKSQQKGIPLTIVDAEIFVGFDRRTERRLKRSLGV
ncbi:MAG: glutaredoxin family protein [Candidatus Thorarchaeota archaeon]